MIQFIPLVVTLVVAAASAAVASVALRQAKRARSMARLAIDVTLEICKTANPPMQPTKPSRPEPRPAHLRLMRGGAA